MHKLADQIIASVSIPFLHIADATAKKIVAAGMIKIGLLGTRFTMEHDFYKGRLIRDFGLDVLVPNEKDRNIIHRVIYEELVQGKIMDGSREEYKRIIESLIAQGAEGVILGCTEIELLVKQQDSRVPLFPTTNIHAIAAVEYALS
jgi:aspartate racemase